MKNTTSAIALLFVTMSGETIYPQSNNQATPYAEFVELQIKKQKEAHPDRYTDNTKDTNNTKSANDTRFQTDGHLYTTFVVARLAGLDLQTAHEIAYGSELPDDRKEFNALWSRILVWDQDYKHEIVCTLHSLHGGGEDAVKLRRTRLQEIVRKAMNSRKDNPSSEDNLKNWQIGAIIHAFGDSYAHTYKKDGKLYAYNPRLGHLFDGHKPDVLAHFPNKYEEYIQALHKALSTGQDDAKEGLKQLHRTATARKESQSDAIKIMQGYAAGYGYWNAEKERVRTNLENVIEAEDMRLLLEYLKNSLTSN